MTNENDQLKYYSVPRMSKLLLLSQHGIRIRLHECIEAGILPDTCHKLNGQYWLTQAEYEAFHKHLWNRRQLARAHRSQAARAVRERKASLLGRMGLR